MGSVAPPLFWLFGGLKNVDHRLHPTLFQKLCLGKEEVQKHPFLEIFWTPFQAKTRGAFKGVMNQKKGVNTISYIEKK